MINKPKIDIVFAYGSNMCTARLKKRAPSVTPIGRARLTDKHLICNKKSNDGSGKANIMERKGEIVWGVLFEIDTAELNTLDNYEKGYERINIDVQIDADLSQKAYAYIATKPINLTDDPRPYEEYKDYIVSGALEHKLPSSYINFLKQIKSKPDLRNSDKSLWVLLDLPSSPPFSPCAIIRVNREKRLWLEISG